MSFADEIRQMASDLSSPDLVVSMEARRKMSDLLAPEKIVILCHSAENASLLENLLTEVAQHEVAEVYGAIGSTLERLFSDPHAGPEVVTDAKYLFITSFVIATLRHEETSIANTATPSVLALMQTADRCGAAASAVWTIIDEQLRCEAVLRLFNCDAIDSAEVNNVCQWLLAHTGLAQFIFDATCRLFSEDLLSLFNYLVVCGALSHHTTLPNALQKLVCTALESVDDGLVVTAACHFCGVALRRSEQNAKAYGIAWISRALKALKASRETVEDAVFDVVGSASTTSPGWLATLESGMESSLVSDCLTSFSNTSRSSGLQLLQTLLSSPFVDDNFFSNALLQEAWLLRSNPEEPIRLGVWKVMSRVLDKEVLRKNLVAVVASNLCGPGSHDDNVAVRSAQLEVTRKLLALNSLPAATREALTARAEKGLYPPGSTGVAAMTRD